MNNVTIIGRLVRDIELRFVPTTGMAVANFTLAIDRELSKEKKQEAISQGKQTADFISITAFGKQAENCANFLAKGSQTAVVGRITSGSFTTQTGEKRYTTTVVADRVEFIGRPKEQQEVEHNNLPEDIFQSVDDEDIPF